MTLTVEGTGTAGRRVAGALAGFDGGWLLAPWPSGRCAGCTAASRRGGTGVGGEPAATNARRRPRSIAPVQGRGQARGHGRLNVDKKPDVWKFYVSRGRPGRRRAHLQADRPATTTARSTCVYYYDDDRRADHARRVRPGLRRALRRDGLLRRTARRCARRWTPTSTASPTSGSSSRTTSWSASSATPTATAAPTSGSTTRAASSTASATTPPAPASVDRWDRAPEGDRPARRRRRSPPAAAPAPAADLRHPPAAAPPAAAAPAAPARAQTAKKSAAAREAGSPRRASVPSSVRRGRGAPGVTCPARSRRAASARPARRTSPRSRTRS